MKLLIIALLILTTQRGFASATACFEIFERPWVMTDSERDVILKELHELRYQMLNSDTHTSTFAKGVYSIKMKEILKTIPAYEVERIFKQLSEKMNAKYREEREKKEMDKAESTRLSEQFKKEMEMVQEFLDQVKLKIDEKSTEAKDFDKTPLHLAIEMDRTELIIPLLRMGADIEARAKFGFTPFLIAANYGKTDALKLLIENGADVNVTSDGGHTALHLSVLGGFRSTDLLVNVLKDINALSENSKTALFIAIEKNRIDDVKLLISHGAEIRGHYAPEKVTPVQRAAELKHYQIEKLLVEELTKPQPGTDVVDINKKKKNYIKTLFGM